MTGEVVDDFIEPVVASRGRAGGGAEGGGIRDADRRADLIDHGCQQVAVGELSAGLVHGARVYGVDVGDRDGLVQVAQVGAAAGVGKTTGVARVDAGDVIEAVTGGKLVFVAHLVIDLEEKVVVADRVGIDGDVRWAGVEQLTGIFDRSKDGIDRRRVGRSDGQEVGLVELTVLEVAEVERAILDNGAARRDAGLTLRVRQQPPAVGVRSV